MKPSTRIFGILFALLCLFPIPANAQQRNRAPVPREKYNVGCRQRYTKNALAEINQYWIEQKPIIKKGLPSFEGSKIKSLFKIVVFKTGEIQSVSVLKPSDSHELDAKAVEAITAMKSLPALPESFPFNMDSQVISAYDWGKEDPGEPEANFGTIIALLQRKIKTTWQPPGIYGEDRHISTTVVFAVDMANRRIYLPKITNSSCNLEFDAAALRALHNSSPLPKKMAREIEKLPPRMQKGLIDVEFIFGIDTYHRSPYGGF